MKHTIILKGLIIVFGIIAAPRFVFADDGKPSGTIKINYTSINQIVADTTLPAQDQKTSEKKEEKTDNNNPVEVVKVIPKARRQAIPVPVKVNVQPIKIIRQNIIKPVVKPVIRILH
jgi:hypothetical protein